MSETLEKASRGTDAELERVAIEWLTLIQSSHMTPRQQSAFLSWLESSSTHQEAFIRAEALWQKGAVLAKVNENRVRAARNIKTFTLSPAQIFLGVGSFATVCVLVFVLVIGTSNFQSKELYLVSEGKEQPVYQLQDGSNVTLNVGSSMRVDLSSADFRRVDLTQGEAYFEVSHNPKRPFVIETQSGKVTVLGTRFSVVADEQGTQVTVLDGRVMVENRLSPGDAPVLLSKNQQTVVNDQTSMTVQSVDANKVLAWREGMLRFSGDTLEYVAEQLNRYYSESIQLKDPSLGQLKIVAVLPLSNSLKDNLAILEQTLGLVSEADVSGGTYILSKP